MLQLPFEFYALDFAALLIWNDFTMQRLIRRFPWARPTGTGQIVPPELKPRFFHLYGDIGWYGLVAGTTIAFLAVYAARIGANAYQIGMITAGPALINLIFTLPAGRWLQSRPIGNSVFRSAFAFRGQNGVRPLQMVMTVGLV